MKNGKGDEYLAKGDLWVEYLPDDNGGKYISVGTANGAGMEFVGAKNKTEAVRQLKATLIRFQEIIEKIKNDDIEYDEWIWGESKRRLK